MHYGTPPPFARRFKARGVPHEHTLKRSITHPWSSLAFSWLTSVWLKLRASLYEAQIGLGVRLVSAKPPPSRAPR